LAQGLFSYPRRQALHVERQPLPLTQANDSPTVIIHNFAAQFKNERMMSSKNDHFDISYYRLSLTDFLRESHPELFFDNNFIAVRSEAATEAYSQAIQNGSNQIEAAETADEILFEGLHFSRHDTLVNILWNEFADEVPEDEAKTLAIRLLPECESVFANYSLSEGFAYKPEYELLYSELTGTVALYLESHELQ
jgi:hypothetical protein